MGSIFKGARNATEFGPVPLTRSMRLDIAALWIGRIGFAGRGLLWSSIGIASVAAAVEDYTPVGTAGAVRWLADNTVGLTFIIIALIGVASYAFWRFFEGSLGLAVDPDDKKVKQILIGRIVPFGSGIGYVTFGTIIILGLISNNDGTTALSSLSQELAESAAGKVLFTIAGVILFGVAIGWLFRLGRGTFKYMYDHELLAADDIKWSKNSKREPASKLVFSLAYVGTPGRTILFLLLSILVFREAYDPNARDTSTGFGNALGQLQGNVGGKILLGLDGMLLLIFGIYSFFLTRYKKFLYYHPHVRALKQTQIITPPHITFTSKLKSLFVHQPNASINV